MGASPGQCQGASPGRSGQGRSGLVMSRSSRRVVYSDMSLYLFVPFSQFALNLDVYSSPLTAVASVT